MAFSSFVTDRYMRAGGVLVEEGKYTMTAGTTTGTITPATSGNGLNSAIVEITQDSFGTASGASLIGRVYGSGRKNVAITSSVANETGTYILEGRAA